MFDLGNRNTTPTTRFNEPGLVDANTNLLINFVINGTNLQTITPSTRVSG